MSKKKNKLKNKEDMNEQKEFDFGAEPQLKFEDDLKTSPVELTEEEVVSEAVAEAVQATSGPDTVEPIYTFADKTKYLIGVLNSMLVQVRALGRKSVDHANAISNLEQCIKSLENDARL